MWHARNGEAAQCAYWLNSPYSGTCTATKVYDSSGKVTGYVCKESGDSLPSDYNGNFGDCKELFEFWKEVMNVQKVCSSNAYENGCIPKYEGNDTVYKASYPDADDIEVSNATAGCPGFNQAKILSTNAFILTDGTIIFSYANTGARIIAIDVNGFKGPNKWGYDLHPFVIKGNLYEDSQFFPGGCEFLERGGISGKELLYKEH